MKDNFIHVAFIIDESGSMYSSTNDVVGGFNQMIEEQKKENDGQCSISLFTFNNRVKEVYLGKDVNDINGINYSPNGCTAMNDGIGSAIDKIGQWLNNMDEAERPSKNIIVIMTDGEENASQEYSLEKVKEMIKHQENKYNWTFIYMGTDLTNLKDANSLGIKLRSVSSRKEFSTNYTIVNSALSSLRKNDKDALLYCENALKERTMKYETEKNIKL